MAGKKKKDNDLFAPPTPEELKAAGIDPNAPAQPEQDLFAPPTAEELASIPSTPAQELIAPQNDPRTAQALLRGASSTARLIEGLVTGQSKFGKDAPQYIEQAIPEVKNPTLVQQGAQAAGSMFLDPFSVVTGLASGAATNRLYTAVSPLQKATTQAELEFAKNATTQTATKLYQKSLLNSAAREGLTAAAGTAAYTATEKVLAGEGDIAKVAEEAVKNAGIAGIVGAGFGVGVTALKGKPKFDVTNMVPGKSTALDTELARELESQLATQHKLKSQAERLKPKLEKQAELIKGVEPLKVSEYDKAAQEAAMMDFLLPNEPEAIKMAGVHTQLDERLQKLNDRHQRLVNDLKSGVKKGNEVVKDLQDTGERIAAINQMRDQLGFQAPVKQEGSTYNRYDYLQTAQDVVDAQVQKVDQAVKKGLISPEKAATIRQLEADNALKTMGIDLSQEKIQDFGSFLGRQVDFDNIQKATGVRTGEGWFRLSTAKTASKNMRSQVLATVDPAIAALNKLGLSDDQIGNMLRYVEATPQGPIFNPNPSNHPKNLRPVFEGPAPTPEQMQQLSVLRDTFDNLQNQLNERSGLKVGYIPGYVPIYELPQIQAMSKTAGAVLDPSIAQARISGDMVPGVHDFNVRNLFARYSNKAAETIHMRQPYMEAVNEYHKLVASRRPKEAQKYFEALNDMMGVKDTKSAAEILSGTNLERNFSALQEIAERTDDPANALTEMWKESNKLMYESLVSANPATLLKQAIQPEVLGLSELSAKHHTIGRIAALNSKSELNQRASKLLKYAMVDDVQALTELEKHAPKTSAGKAIAAIGVPLKPTTKLYGKVEKINRLTALSGALSQFDDAVKTNQIPQILEGLSVGEKSFVMSAVNKGNLEQAANRYALVKNQRINFSYDTKNKPELLRNSLGKLIPFTGFARGITDRLASDVLQKNYKNVAKTVVVPLVLLETFRQMTGYDIKGANPVEAVPGLLTPSLAPQVTEPAKTLVKTKSFKKAGEELLKYTPIGAGNRILKAKSGADLLGLQKEGEGKRGYWQQLAKDLESIE